MDEYPRSPNAGARAPAAYSSRFQSIPPTNRTFRYKKITEFSLGRGKEFEAGELLCGGTGPRLRAICLTFLKEKEQ